MKGNRVMFSGIDARVLLIHMTLIHPASDVNVTKVIKSVSLKASAANLSAQFSLSSPKNVSSMDFMYKRIHKILKSILKPLINTEIVDNDQLDPDEEDSD